MISAAALISSGLSSPLRRCGRHWLATCSARLIPLVLSLSFSMDSARKVPMNTTMPQEFNIIIGSAISFTTSRAAENGRAIRRIRSI